MDIREVRAMVLQLKKVDFASCEEYIVDLIENYGYSQDEVHQLKIELIELYTSSRKYAKSFEMYQQILQELDKVDNEIGENESDASDATHRKIQIMRKLVHLAQISSQPTKDEILEELNDCLPFEDDPDTQELIIEVLQNNKMNSKLYKVPEGLEEAA
jgi:hypothetical protein